MTPFETLIAILIFFSFAYLTILFKNEDRVWPYTWKYRNSVNLVEKRRSYPYSFDPTLLKFFLYFFPETHFFIQPNFFAPPES